MKTTQLDAFLKKKLLHIEITPKKDSWGKVQDILRKKQKRRVVLYKCAVAVSVLITLSGVFAFYEYVNTLKYEKSVHNISVKENIIQTNSVASLYPKEQISKIPLPEKIKKEKHKDISKKNTLTKQIHTNIFVTTEASEVYKETQKTSQQGIEPLFIENISYVLPQPETLEIPHITISPIPIPTIISKKRKNIWSSIGAFFQKAEDFNEKYSLENLLQSTNKQQIEYAYLVEIKSNKKY